MARVQLHRFEDRAAERRPLADPAGFDRRSFMAAAAAVASTGAASASAADKPADKPVKKVLWEGGKRPEKTDRVRMLISATSFPYSAWKCGGL